MARVAVNLTPISLIAIIGRTQANGHTKRPVARKTPSRGLEKLWECNLQEHPGTHCHASRQRPQKQEQGHTEKAAHRQRRAPLRRAWNLRKAAKTTAISTPAPRYANPADRPNHA